MTDSHQIYIKKFITLFVVLFLILFAMVGFMVYNWSKSFYINETQNQLLHDTKLISYNIKDTQNQDLDKLVNRIKNDLNIQITITNESVKIIAKSYQTKMSHDNFLLVTQKFEDDKHNTYNIKCAKSIDELNTKILILGFQVVAIIILFFIFMILIVMNINTQIQEEVDKILKFLYGLTKKKRDNHINSSFSLEFNEITKYLTKVSKILTKQDKQKEKYTKRLKLSNTQKDDIISAISHEFKNPISVISGYSQTLIEQKDIKPEIRDKFLNKIYNNTQRLDLLIDTLRLSTKLDQNKQIIIKSKVKLSKIIDESIELLQSSYPKRVIKVQIKEDMTLKVDETLFSIVVVNLIENALKYSQNDILIAVEKESLKVIDSGIGISKEDIAKITDKFYRVSNNSWNNSLGLGLSIVTNILKLHNFKLEIDSIKDKGSTFMIFFK
jgi:signal transduction histidine kinase